MRSLLQVVYLLYRPSVLVKGQLESTLLSSHSPLEYLKDSPPLFSLTRKSDGVSWGVVRLISDADHAYKYTAPDQILSWCN